MKTTQRNVISTIAVALLLSSSGCANMNEKDRNTAYGAGAGAVAGAVVTGGSPVGTAGGAVVGGLLGRVITDEMEDDKNRK